MGESQGKRERGRSRREHGEERLNSTVNEGRFQGEQGGQAGRTFLPEVQGSLSCVSGHKSSPGRSAESRFHSKSGQT